jgi:hypothetical protein
MKRQGWLAAALALAVAAGITTAATDAQAAVGCRVAYTVTNQWQGGFGADVTIDNLGDPVDGWRLTWTFGAGQTIGSLWNGTVAQSAGQVTVTNTTWARRRRPHPPPRRPRHPPPRRRRAPSLTDG